MKFYDTNIVINNYGNLDKENFIISSVTLEELENIKTNRNKTDDIKYRARQATKWLLEHEENYNVVIYQNVHENIINEHQLELAPDTKICACAEFSKGFVPQGDELIFVTDDIACGVIAKNIFGLKVEKYQSEDQIYTGYKRIIGNTDYINSYFENIDINDWSLNEYAVITNTDDDSEREMRWDGEKFVSLKLPPSKYIKGKNALQRCALDMLMNPDITVCAVLGTYGSGKTFLAMQTALYSVKEKGRQSKILGVREIVGEGKEPGYLPGDLEDKVGAFFEPLVQSLDGGVFELESLKQNGMLETNIPHFMKGTTYNQTIILCDEAEDLSESQIRLIGTRLGENSRIFLSGDFKQSLFNKSANNPLLRMCNEFRGNKNFACVCLEEDVRSETSKMFAELYK